VPPTTATYRRGFLEMSGVPALGAPGVYVVAPTAQGNRPGIEPLDVAAFVGVAARGPAYPVLEDPDVLDGQPFRARSVATPVDSWDDYLELFGSGTGPGLLPHAVASYFAQGGRRAYIVRVVPPRRCPTGAGAPQKPEVVHPGVDDAPAGCAEFRVGGPAGWQVWARNEGRWGNRLSVRVNLTCHPLSASPVIDADPMALTLPAAGSVLPGTTIRVQTTPGTRDSATDTMYCQVVALRRAMPGRDAGSGLVAVLDRPIPAASPTTASPGAALVYRFDVVEAELVVNDTDPDRQRGEQHLALGLDPAHPRWVVDVVNSASRLVQMPSDTPPGVPHLEGPEEPASAPSTLDAVLCVEGQDRWDEIGLEDLFARADDLGSRGGVGAVSAPEVADEIACVVVPDLYAPGPGAGPAGTIPAPASAAFVPCGPPTPATRVAPPPELLSGLRLDPTDPAAREQIVRQQRQLVTEAETMSVVALLDVPPGLTPAQVLTWRSSFDSSFAACYTPWVSVPDGAGGLVELPPSAPAAGVIARTELVHGLARGPANELLVGIVDVERDIPAAEHGLLHQLGVNVCRPDVDGIRLTAARTLSTDSAWRQLTVRRLLMAIERTVRRQLQWTVFEPDNALLRDGLRRQLDGLLGALFEQGCFAGSTPAESWFVAMASGRDVARESDQGQVVVEVGVAPSEPLEFVLLRIAVQAEGDLRTAVVGTEVGSRA
jgi:hypothetical protein